MEDLGFLGTIAGRLWRKENEIENTFDVEMVHTRHA
jgi:hypothetical protein